MMEAHAGQTDKAGMPYHTHPERVEAILVGLYQAPYFVRVAALLHDVVEDTPLTPERLLEMGVSTESVSIIHRVSRRKGETYAQFIQRIADTKDIWTIRVKLADLRDNLSRPLPPEMEGIHRRYKKAKKVLLEALAGIPCPACGYPVLFGKTE